ncbi:MAG: hypothetical protein V2L15_10925 [Desulfobacteraceae bacterium]|nr:hypothetical protein [Desulfobacteraceae bacterium]
MADIQGRAVEEAFLETSLQVRGAFGHPGADHGQIALEIAGVPLQTIDIQLVAFAHPGCQTPADKGGLFENQNLLIEILGQDACRSQTGDTGSNDQDIVIFLHFSTSLNGFILARMRPD